MKKLLSSALITAALFSLAGCQSNEPKSTAAAPEVNNQDLYEVEHEGRYYVFDDFKTYHSFLTVGETSYRKVFIGGGPHGETLVFGLRSQDKKKAAGIAGVDMYQGKLAAADNFYGELRGEDGRLYVFSTLADMEAVRTTGEAAYRFTQIGAGPDGQTVVFVLNKGNKKKRPDALMAQYKQANGL